MKTNKVVKTIIYSRYIVIILSLLIIPVTPLSAEEIVMVSPRAPDSIEGKWFTQIYTEAFSRLGWTFIYKQYPSKRCAILSNLGDVDGEMERVSSFNSTYTNLIRVEESLQTLKFVAYAADNTLVIDDWESLKGKKLRVNYRHGIKLFEENLPKVVSPERLEYINSPVTGFKKLIANRADVYMDIESVASPVLQTEEFVQSQITRVGLLEQVQTNPFLHKKHKDRVSALAKVLREMKEEGLFNLYRERAKK